ncbi:hypothetical protein BDZ91DRAFT_800171 [Kalaharituber pfeilii]|nr:hypothetical protein BDZ91DRAFT_800171 [Kalaharituber pfeilii]
MQLQLKRPDAARKELSLCIAEAFSRGENTARRIHIWEKSWITSRYIKVGMRGKYAKVSSWLNDEGVLLAIREYITSVGEKLTSHGLAQAITAYLKEEDIVNGADKLENSISERTARTWLNKLGFQWKDVRKGVYIDGHEREDVVAYRQKVFLPALQKLEGLRQWDEKGNIIPSAIPAGEKEKIFVTHDESTFNANDGKRQMWIKDNAQPLRKKGRGKGIMVSEFLTPRGRLAVPPNISAEGLPRRQATEFLEYGQDNYWTGEKMVQHVVDVAIPIFERAFPGCQAVFLFDNASNHAAFAPDALVVNEMNLGPGGKQPILREGFIHAKQRPQAMVFPDNYPDPALRGKPKAEPTFAENFDMDEQKQCKMLNPLGSQHDSAEVNSIKSSSLWQRSLQIAQRKLSEKRLPPLEFHDIPTQSASEIIQLTIRDLQTIIHTIQHNDHAVAVGWLQEILLVFKKYTTFVDTAVPLLLLYMIFSHNLGVITLAWVTIRGILQVALNHLEVTKNLETTIAAIVEKIALYEFYDNIYTDILALDTLSLDTPSSATPMHTPQQILASALLELYASILIFSVKVRQCFDPSFTSKTLQYTGWNLPSYLGIRKSGSIWRTSAVEFQPFIDEIFKKERRVRECADMAKMEISMKGPARLQHLLSNIESKMASLGKLEEIISTKAENLKSMKERNLKAKEKKVQRLLRMLSPLEAWKRHQDVLSRRVDGTGTWLLEQEHFRLWCDPTNSPGDRILCCFGGVGTGKTVLSSIVIEHLLHEFPERDKVGIAWLYGDYRDQGSQTLNNILGSFLKQLLTAASQVPDTITSILESIQKQEKKVDNSNVIQILRLTLPLFDSIFVCIDAADELEPQTRISLLKVIQSEFSTARIFLTGRPHVRSEIDKCLEMERRNDIEIMVDQGDIKKCLVHHLALDTHPDAMNEELENEILSTILEQSQVTFLFPALHIRTLLEQRTIAKRRKALKKLSLSQNNVIACMIDRVTNSQSCRSELGMQVLMWLHLAYRSLKLDELRHALAVQQGDLDLDKDNIPSTESLTECSLGLVVIDEDTSTVRFVHHLLDEYLKQHSKAYFPNGHSTAAETSLTYLNFVELASPCPTNAELEQKKSDFAFLDYAACHWGHHIRQQSNDSAAELAGKLLRQSNRQPHSALGALCMPLYPGESEPSLEGFMGIHAAAYFGFETEMATLVNKYAGWDSKDGHGRTPLSYAAMEGHVALVRLLVDREDVDADLKDNYGGTPLSWAATRGHEAIVRLLVERGDVNAGSFGGVVTWKFKSNSEVARAREDEGKPG